MNSLNFNNIATAMSESMAAGTAPALALREAVASLSRQMTVRCYLRAVGQMDDAFEADIARTVDLQISQLFDTLILHGLGRDGATFASELAQTIVDASDQAIADLKAASAQSGGVQ